MCRDKIKTYEKHLEIPYSKPGTKKITRGRGVEGEEFKAGVPYWHMVGTEAYGIVRAESILAEELLVRF